ncbi:hypothetical protein Cni_G15811 [Canna indica]|uniref:Uncharacterized protein n=1 Tax=Canna indica TaxID=4628 RepID=A0AAQ3KEG8_9LILI|nr:hypothetical protein Cni_G15811 [Canna indica]
MADSLASPVIVLHVCEGICLRYPLAEPCATSGYLRAESRNCTDPSCCKDGVMYPQFRCSPPVTANTPARMIISSFAAGGDGGGAAECDGNFYTDDQMVVSMSTGWYDGGGRCHSNITIDANGRSVSAMVVDECDSVNGCVPDENFQPPCANNVIVASPLVWRALAIPDAVGDYNVTWSDA